MQHILKFKEFRDLYLTEGENVNTKYSTLLEYRNKGDLNLTDKERKERSDLIKKSMLNASIGAMTGGALGASLGKSIHAMRGHKDILDPNRSALAATGSFLGSGLYANNDKYKGIGRSAMVGNIAGQAAGSMLLSKYNKKNWIEAKSLPKMLLGFAGQRAIDTVGTAGGAGLGAYMAYNNKLRRSRNRNVKKDSN